MSTPSEADLDEIDRLYAEAECDNLVFDSAKAPPAAASAAAPPVETVPKADFLLLVTKHNRLIDEFNEARGTTIPALQAENTRLTAEVARLSAAAPAVARAATVRAARSWWGIPIPLWATPRRLYIASAALTILVGLLAINNFLNPPMTDASIRAENVRLERERNDAKNAESQANGKEAGYKSQIQTEKAAKEKAEGERDVAKAELDKVKGTREASNPPPPPPPPSGPPVNGEQPPAVVPPASGAGAPIPAPRPGPPAAPAQAGVGEWQSGKDLFKIEGTPDGFELTSVNEPVKSAQCQPPRHLYRTNVCKKEADGNVTCKLGCN